MPLKNLFIGHASPEMRETRAINSGRININLCLLCPGFIQLRVSMESN